MIPFFVIHNRLSSITLLLFFSLHVLPHLLQLLKLQAVRQRIRYGLHFLSLALSIPVSVPVLAPVSAVAVVLAAAPVSAEAVVPAVAVVPAEALDLVSQSSGFQLLPAYDHKSYTPDASVQSESPLLPSL